MKLAGMALIDGVHRLIDLDTVKAKIEELGLGSRTFDAEEGLSGFRPMWIPVRLQGVVMQLVQVDDDTPADSLVWWDFGGKP